MATTEATARSAMKLALEALKELVAQTKGRYFCMKHDHVALQNARFAIARLREALANEALDKMAENARELGLDYEPAQQEPVAFLDWYDNAHWGNEDFKAGCWRAWDAALAQRTWVSLTDEQVIKTFNAICNGKPFNVERILELHRAIEAKLKEKNCG